MASIRAVTSSGELLLSVKMQSVVTHVRNLLRWVGLEAASDLSQALPSCTFGARPDVRPASPVCWALPLVLSIAAAMHHLQLDPVILPATPAFGLLRYAYSTVLPAFKARLGVRILDLS